MIGPILARTYNRAVVPSIPIDFVLFGLTLAGRNLKHALARAKAMLVDSGYHVYPYKEQR